MPHLHEKIDFTVSAYIVHADKILLIHHTALQKWLPIGGHIELDENPDQALLREIQEECGLEAHQIEILAEKLDLLSPGTTFLYRPRFIDIHEITPTHRHTVLTYPVRAKTNKIRLAPEEHTDIRWFTADELQNPDYHLAPSIKHYCLDALRLAHE